LKEKNRNGQKANKCWLSVAQTPVPSKMSLQRRPAYSCTDNYRAQSRFPPYSLDANPAIADNTAASTRNKEYYA
jgi:hypothetical protein